MVEGGANADEVGVNKLAGWAGGWLGNKGWEEEKALDDVIVEDVGGKELFWKAEFGGAKLLAGGFDCNEETRGLDIEGLRGGVMEGGAKVWLAVGKCWLAEPYDWLAGGNADVADKGGCWNMEF